MLLAKKFYTVNCFMRPNPTLPEKLALRLVFGPSQLRWGVAVVAIIYFGDVPRLTWWLAPLPLQNRLVNSRG